jgi:hypothetical protein
VRYACRVRRFILAVAKAVLPDKFIEWYRRRRALRRYLRALAYEVYHRQVRIDLRELEGRIAARRDGFYERMVKDVLERTELILQELDRRVEGLSARHGSELRAQRREIAALRERLLALNPPVEEPAPVGRSTE